MIFKEQLLKDCPELIPHLGAERPVLGKCLKDIFDQFRGHGGQDLDDCPQITASGIGTLDSFQFAEEEVGTRLSVDPFHCLNDLDAFLPIVVTVYEEAEEKDPCFRPSMDVHGTQHVQPRPELPVIIGKCLFQDTVDGELSRIEEALLRDPWNVFQLFLNVH